MEAVAAVQLLLWPMCGCSLQHTRRRNTIVTIGTGQGLGCQLATARDEHWAAKDDPVHPQQGR